MGPRFNGVEDLRPIPDADVLHLLQWGHALMAWKTVDGDFKGSRVYTLQWGHALMAWKTGLSPMIPVGRADASMGPRFNGVEDRPRRTVA